MPRDGYLGENVFFGQEEEATEFQVQRFNFPTDTYAIKFHFTCFIAPT